MGETSQSAAPEALLQGGNEGGPSVSSGLRCPFASFLALAIFSVMAHAGDFQAANQLFDAGKFSEAKQHYDQLVQDGKASANVFYNLGNTDYRLGAPGPAMLDYERALALDSAHPEARANLDLLRRQAGARLWPESRLDRVFPGRNHDIYVVVASGAIWLAVFCFALIVIKPRREKAGLWFGAIAGLIAAAYTGAAVWHLERNGALAIVIPNDAEARLAPAESAGPAGTLPAGSQVRVLSERGNWIYCELPGAGRGWLSATAIERIKPAKT